MPKLTDHFSLEEMTFSETAVRHGLNNKPDAASRQNLLELCENMLEPIREIAGGPINVTSGYRSPTLNSIIAGAPDSQHKTGQAADINYPLVRRVGPCIASAAGSKPPTGITRVRSMV